MKTVYACTFVEKCANRDNLKTGMDPKNEFCVFRESCSLTAETLPGLLEALEKRFYMKIDDVFLPTEEDTVSLIGFNRLETGDGEKPSEQEIAAWKKGKGTLYLADYSFSIEKRQVGEVPREEFAGIKHH
jgi:hypothetical protein